MWRHRRCLQDHAMTRNLEVDVFASRSFVSAGVSVAACCMDVHHEPHVCCSLLLLGITFASWQQGSATVHLHATPSVS